MSEISPLNSSFLGILLILEQVFTNTMATALLRLNRLASKPDGKLQAMRQASDTFRLVKQSLHDPCTVNGFTIAAVVSMA